MLALKLTDIKDFMNKLLRSDIFDHFLLQEADILTGASFVIDGHINKDFYSLISSIPSLPSAPTTSICPL